MRVVAALGGNALLRRGETPDADIQEHHVIRAAAALAPLASDHELVITHGNGPQVGVLAQESARDPDLTHPYPFDVLGAQTQGMIGYWLAQALQNSVPDREVVSLITRTVVDREDPAFEEPTKFVGPLYSQAEAQNVLTKLNWRMAKDGAAWRRVVASPWPQRILELSTIVSLVDLGRIVICCGGGGIPVVDTGECLRGVEAVVDKDRAAALLAGAIGADRLLILTDVSAVMKNYGTSHAEELRRVTIDDLDPRDFPAGSMRPKIEAAIQFVKSTGAVAAIGSIEEAQEVLAGRSGTMIGVA